MTRLLLLGGGGHCRSCIDVIESTGAYEIIGIVQGVEADRSPVLGYPVIGCDDDLLELLKECPHALVTVGQIKNPTPRIRLFEAVKSAKASLPMVASPKAHLSTHATIGEGSIVMHGAVINAAATIAENCIVNTHALIEHDARIEAHCHISTGAKVNGGVIVRAGCFIGSGSVLREGIEIGRGAIIGAGQVVLHNVPAGAVLRSIS